MSTPYDALMQEANLNHGTIDRARATCLMYLGEGLDAGICDPQNYVDEDCPDVRQVDFLPDDLIDDAASARVVALRMLRYAYASGFAKVPALATACAVSDAPRMRALANELFDVVSPQELLAYGVAVDSDLLGGAA